jgi:hypothetical protein
MRKQRKMMREICETVLRKIKKATKEEEENEWFVAIDERLDEIDKDAWLSRSAKIKNGSARSRPLKLLPLTKHGL